MLKPGWIILFLCCFLISCTTSKFSKADIRSSQKLIGLEFSDQYIDTMYNYLKRNLEAYDTMRTFHIPNETFPSILFDPHPSNFVFPEITDGLKVNCDPVHLMVENEDELAYASIAELSELIKNRKISSVELTSFFLKRLKKYDPVLKCAVTITDNLAMEQARKADRDLANGIYRGPLHGIPYGVKDLIAVQEYKTTWGAEPYKDQEIEHTATVVRKLEEAGAVLIAKLTSGALARGDVWYGGQTKNPWDTAQGASGSSAGSGSATAAGLVVFSLGTETLGSITSPSNRNGITGLRPTYGRVSRDGVMSLSWSMDKVGPMCRSAEDCAFVFDVLRGKDSLDATTRHAGFHYDCSLDWKDLKIAILDKDIDQDTTAAGDNLRKVIELLDSVGLQMDSLELPSSYPFRAFDIILRSEAGAMFDDLVRFGDINLMVEQSQRSRANSLRQSRFIPAVEYLQANRFRKLLIEEIHQLFLRYDVIIAPTLGRNQLWITNLTGHPVVTIPTGHDKKGHPTSMTIIGNLYREGTILSFANAFQKITGFHLDHPPGFGN